MCNKSEISSPVKSSVSIEIFDFFYHRTGGWSYLGEPRKLQPRCSLLHLDATVFRFTSFRQSRAPPSHQSLLSRISTLESDFRSSLRFSSRHDLLQCVCAISLPHRSRCWSVSLLSTERFSGLICLRAFLSRSFPQVM
jgi:hypothetical protein